VGGIPSARHGWCREKQLTSIIVVTRPNPLEIFLAFEFFGAGGAGTSARARILASIRRRSAFDSAASPRSAARG
jgi:hypothetical protein